MLVSYYLKTSRFDLSRTHYWHGTIRMLNVNTICKEGDIGHDRYWQLWPANPISNSFWHSQYCRLATSIECYSQVYILHNPIEYALIVVMYLTIASHFFNSWILLICGCLVWFCRPTTCMEYMAAAQPSCLSNTKFHFIARYMPKRQGSASFLLVLVKHIPDHHLSF